MDVLKLKHNFRMSLDVQLFRVDSVPLLSEPLHTLLQFYNFTSQSKADRILTLFQSK